MSVMPAFPSLAEAAGGAPIACTEDEETKVKKQRHDCE